MKGAASVRALTGARRCNDERGRGPPDARRRLRAAAEAWVEGAPDHPLHVGVHRRRGLLEGERGDRPGGIGTDAWQLAQDGGVAGYDAVMLGSHDAGEGMQVGGTAIVAEAGPRLAHC